MLSTSSTRTRMPHKLVDLPRDVLDPCLEELLSPLEPLPMQGHSLKIPIPVDLLSLQLVCKTLYSLALPWVWRRLTISVGSSRSSYPCIHWKQCIAHPERFVHIRLFKLEIYTDTLEDIFAIQSSLGNCISFMDNLQMLILDGPLQMQTNLISKAHITPIIDDFYFVLCSRPRLHTLVVVNYLPMRLRLLAGTNLKRLIIHDVHHESRGFLGVAPSLESLALFGEITLDTGPGLSHLPWDTLRDISFCHLFANPVSVLQDFTAWKVDFPEIHCPLTEIFWECLEVSPEVQLLLTVFEGQNIRTFSLDGIPSVDADFISRVAQAFPQLQRLTLIARDDEGYDGEWGALASIADSLAQMPLLKFFCGNLLANEFEMGPVESCYWDAIRLIAERCHALEHLTFQSSDSMFDISVFPYAIERDDRGAYVGEVRLADDGQHESRKSHFSSSYGWTSAKYDNI